MTRNVIHHPDTAAFRRGLRLGCMLHQGEQITTAKIRTIFDVSKATAKRDLNVLAEALPTQTTIGPNGRVVLELVKP